MKRYTLILITILTLILATALIGCGAPQPAAQDATLTVIYGESETTYSHSDLQEVGHTTIEAGGVTYVGVPLNDLLQHAGIDDPAALSEVTTVASDGFSAAYAPDLFLSPQTIVAYATTQGDLANDEQPFRMVLPDQPGRMNVRMLARIEAGP